MNISCAETKSNSLFYWPITIRAERDGLINIH